MNKGYESYRYAITMSDSTSSQLTQTNISTSPHLAWTLMRDSYSLKNGQKKFYFSFWFKNNLQETKW